MIQCNYDDGNDCIQDDCLSLYEFAALGRQSFMPYIFMGVYEFIKMEVDDIGSSVFLSPAYNFMHKSIVGMAQWRMSVSEGLYMSCIRLAELRGSLEELNVRDSPARAFDFIEFSRKIESQPVE
jgi:hypothetical protein